MTELEPGTYDDVKDASTVADEVRDMVRAGTPPHAVHFGTREELEAIRGTSRGRATKALLDHVRRDADRVPDPADRNAALLEKDRRLRGRRAGRSGMGYTDEGV